MERFFTTVFNFDEFIFVYAVNLRFIRPPDEEKPGEHGPQSFSEIILCQGCFLGNSLLYYSLRHPKLFLAAAFPESCRGPCLFVMANYIYLRTYLATKISGDFQTFEKIIICVF